MPDWMTHIGVGWILYEAFELRLKSSRIKNYRTAWLIGCALPDVSKIGLILSLTRLFDEDLINAFFAPTHTLIGALLLTIIFTSIFKLESKGGFKHTFLPLFCGAVLHLLLDTLNIKVTTGILFFWPITSDDFSLDLIRFDDLRPAAATLAMCGILSILKSRLSLDKRVGARL